MLRILSDEDISKLEQQQIPQAKPITDEDVRRLELTQKPFLTDRDILELEVITSPAYKITKQAEKMAIETGKGLLRGFEGLAAGWGGTVRWIGESIQERPELLTPVPFKGFLPLNKAIGASMANWGITAYDFWRREAQRGIEAPDPELFQGTFMQNPSWTRGVAMTAEAIPSLAAATAITIATGIPIAGAGALGLVEGSDMYVQAREAGKSVKASTVMGGLSVAGTTALEVVPLTTFLRGGPVTKQMFKGAIQEGSEEVLQALWNNMIAKIGFDKTWDLTQGMVEGFIAGAGSGGVVSSFTAGRAGGTDMLYREAVAPTAPGEVVIDPKTKKPLKVGDQILTREDLDTMQEGVKNQIIDNAPAIDEALQKSAKKVKRAARGPRTLLGWVRGKGGINPETAAKDYNISEDFKQFGLISALKKGGQNIDELAATALEEGILEPPPPDRMLSDWFISQLKAKAKLWAQNEIDKTQAQYDKEYNEHIKEKSRKEGKSAEELRAEVDKQIDDIGKVGEAEVAREVSEEAVPDWVSETEPEITAAQQLTNVRLRIAKLEAIKTPTQIDITELEYLRNEAEPDLEKELKQPSFAEVRRQVIKLTNEGRMEEAKKLINTLPKGFERTMLESELKAETTGEIPIQPIYPETGELFQSLSEEAKRRKKPPGVGLSIEQVTTTENKAEVREHFAGVKEVFNNMFRDFFFYRDAPPELRNAIRTDVIGGLTRIRNKINKDVASQLFEGLTPIEVDQAIELIYARNQIARVERGIGDPKLTIEDAQNILISVETKVSLEATKAADRWNTINETYFAGLVQRGRLDPDSHIENYAPLYINDYTPDWIFNKGIPTRLKRPFRGYARKARGTSKEYKQDAEVLLGHLLSIEHDNLLEDFILRYADKYDVIKTMSKQQQIDMFGSYMAFGKTLTPKYPRPGRVYEVGGKKYRAYNPDVPFSRQLFPIEIEEKMLMALGRYKRSYLLPEKVYKTFVSFSERAGNAQMYYFNKAVGWWKSAAILSHFPSFNVNNMAGDTWMSMVQAPEPLLLLAEVDDALSFLTKTTDKHSSFQRQMGEFMVTHAVLDSAFIATELPHIKRASNPLTYLLQKAQHISTFREEIMRTAQTSYLLKQVMKGKAESIIGYYSWIDTRGLGMEAAIGKIAREALIDYNAMSKTYRRVIRGAVFPFGCVDEKTECLTPQGWKKYTEIKAGNQIWSYDIKTNQCRWTKIRGIFKHQFDNDEDMIEIKNRSLNALLTLNHSCPVILNGKRKTVQAQDLETINISTQLPIIANPKDSEGYGISDNWLKLIGWFITDGTKFKKYGYIVIYQSKPQYVKEIRTILTDLTIHFSERVTNSKNTFGKLPKHVFALKVSGSNELNKICPEKKIDRDFICKLSLRQRLVLIEALLKGDGSKRKKNGKWRIFITAKEEQKDSFQMLCSLSGLPTRKVRKGVEIQTRTIRAIRQNGKRLIKRISYKGTIWCPKTGTGYWLARRNGCIFLTGNTWYFKGSALMWRFHKHKPLRAVISFAALSFIAMLFNMFGKRRDMERDLPDYVRHRTHFILGETPAGRIKVWSMQWVPDVLIGTKIYSIAINEAFRAADGEKTWEKAAKDTIKAWGVKEAKGVTYLINPIVRFLKGIWSGRDPYDNSPIYPTDDRRMTPMAVKWHQGLFLIKASMPFLSGYVREYSRGKTSPEIVKQVGEDFIGWGALGIRDYTRDAKVVIRGQEVDYDKVQEVQELLQKETGIICSIEEDFLKIGLPPRQYYETDAFKGHVAKFEALYGSRWPQVRRDLLERVKNGIEKDPKLLEMWAKNNFDRSETQEERQYYQQIIENARNLRMLKQLQQRPVTTREEIRGLGPAKRRLERGLERELR